MTWNRLGQRLCGREVPAKIETSSEVSKVVFRSNNNNVNGDGFKVQNHAFYKKTISDLFIFGLNR